MPAAYDEIADWYEDEFLGDRSEDGLPISDPIGIDRALRELLGKGVGTCLEIGCGKMCIRDRCPATSLRFTEGTSSQHRAGLIHSVDQGSHGH